MFFLIINFLKNYAWKIHGRKRSKRQRNYPPLKNLWGGEVNYSAEYLRLLRRNEKNDCYELPLSTSAAVVEMMREGNLETLRLEVDSAFLKTLKAQEREMLSQGSLQVSSMGTRTVTFESKDRFLRVSVPFTSIRALSTKATLVVKNGRDTKKYKTVIGFPG